MSTHRSFHYDVDQDVLNIYFSDEEPVLQAYLDPLPEGYITAIISVDGHGTIHSAILDQPSAGRWPVSEIITRYSLGVSESEWLIRLSERAHLFRFS